MKVNENVTLDHGSGNGGREGGRMVFGFCKYYMDLGISNSKIRFFFLMCVLNEQKKYGVHWRLFQRSKRKTVSREYS